MSQQTDIKNCFNCRYFLKHYGNIEGYYYVITGSGHCLHKDLPLARSKKIRQMVLPCELWEPYEIQVRERRESIKETLTKMSESLGQIAQILKDDE